MTPRAGGELPQLELDCLAAIWALGPTPVRPVHARLAERGRPLAYTTVLTVLDRLRRKQVVERRRQGRAYLYTALVSRQQMRERALARLVSNYFDSRQEAEKELERHLRPAPAVAPAAPTEPEPEPALLD